jgi:hypothetical protein
MANACVGGIRAIRTAAPSATAIGVLAVAMLAAAGCRGGDGASAYPAASLIGSVTVDGQPVPNGLLQFLPPAGGSAPVVQAEIKDGRYAATGVPLGKIRVLITAVKETGRMDSKSTSQPVSEVMNLIPDRYRDGLDITVATGSGVQNFELKSK